MFSGIENNFRADVKKREEESDVSISMNFGLFLRERTETIIDLWQPMRRSKTVILRPSKHVLYEHAYPLNRDLIQTINEFINWR